MMKLNSMATPYKDTGLVSERESGRRPKYGYGLTLHLNDEQLKALGVKKPFPVGTIIMVEAKAMVESTRESVEGRVDDDGDTDYTEVSMSLQITDMAVEAEGKAKNPAEILYTSS